MSTIIGSARHDENGRYLGGRLGDNLQKKTDDYAGEVSMQYLKDFVKGRSYYMLEPVNDKHARALAESMKTACNNANIGYDQSNRLSIMTYGVNTKQKCECDCSSLVRACIKEAMGLSLKNFTTADEVTVLVNSGLFKKPTLYRTGAKVYEGTVFVTTSKGHTGIAVDGLKRVVEPPKKYIYNGVDYAKVFDHVYYANANPDVKKAYGLNDILLFNHFILFGCNEKSRVGKTISTFNVEVYGSHSPDLIKVFGKCEEGNYFPFYKHYCEFGYKEDRRII